jgi:hypothetical protein
MRLLQAAGFFLASARQAFAMTRACQGLLPVLEFPSDASVVPPGRPGLHHLKEEAVFIRGFLYNPIYAHGSMIPNIKENNDD